MRLLGGRIIAEPTHTQEYNSGVLMVGMKKENKRVSKVVSGIDAEYIFHKAGYYNDVVINSVKSRILDRKNVLMWGDIRVTEKEVQLKHIKDVTIHEDWIAVTITKIEKKIVLVDGQNPTRYQSTRVLAQSNNEKIGIKKGDMLIVRPVAIVAYTNIMKNGTPTWFYVRNEMHILISVGDVIAKQVGNEIIPLHNYVLIKENYDMADIKQRMDKAGLVIPDGTRIKTMFGNIVAGGEKLGLDNGTTIIFEKNLIVPIHSELVYGVENEGIIYRVEKRNVIAYVDFDKKICTQPNF